MRERLLKFIGMVMIVVAVGVSLTLLNLRWRERTSESLAVETGNNSGEVQVVLEDVQATPMANLSAEETDRGEGRKQADAEPAMITGDRETAVLSSGAEPGEAAGQSLERQADNGGAGESARQEAVIVPEEGADEERISLEDKAEDKVKETAAVYIEANLETGDTEKESVRYRISYELLISDEDSGLAARAEDYYSRLNDMDIKLTKREEEAAKKTAADQKAVADEALKFWDDELNLVYQALRASMTEDEFDALRTEERAWLRSRDAAANEAAASVNQSNSAQNLAYTRSLVKSTKIRVYELAELYYGE